MNQKVSINQQSSDKLKKNNLYKPLIVAGLSLSLIGLVSLPSWGLFGLQIGNYSISVDLKLDKLWKGWQAKLQQSLNQALGQISSLGDMGALGLPDPIAIRRDIESIEGFEGWDESNEIDRIYTEILASETSSKTGQEKVKDTEMWVKQQADESSSDANFAQGEVITQNVLKHMARQNSRQTAVLGTIQENMSDLNRKQDASNLVLSNISETVDKEQRYQEEQQQARANATLEILGYAALYK